MQKSLSSEKEMSAMNSLMQLITSTEKDFQEKRQSKAVFSTCSKAYNTMWRADILNHPHPGLFVNHSSLISCGAFKIVGVMFENTFRFEEQICSISSSVTQKICLLRKFFLGFWEIRMSY